MQVLWEVLLFFLLDRKLHNSFRLLFDHFWFDWLLMMRRSFQSLTWCSFRRLPRLLALLEVGGVFGGRSEWRFMHLESRLGPPHGAGGRKR